VNVVPTPGWALTSFLDRAKTRSRGYSAWSTNQ